MEMDSIDSLETLTQRRGISESKLARRIGKRDAYITKLVCGNANLLMETMVKLAQALDGELSVRAHANPDSTSDESDSTDIGPNLRPYYHVFPIRNSRFLN